MMIDLLYINWTASPEIIGIGPVSLRWYGLSWALSFLVGQYIMTNIYKQEQKPEKEVETLTLYIILGAVFGARFGHCIFYGYDAALGYNPYFKNPLDMLKVWEGGMASHGGAFGTLFAMFLFTRKFKETNYLWLADRLSIITLLTGFFIRMGNLMNSEIVGKQTDVPWAFTFPLNDNGALIPRHPSQLYEALSCLLLFAITYFYYSKTKGAFPNGRIFGFFMFFLFLFRFFYEYLKENQSDFENGMLFNMGQILSIPLMLIGLFIFIRSFVLKTKA